MSFFGKKKRGDALPLYPDYRPAQRNPERLFFKDAFNHRWCLEPIGNSITGRAILTIFLLLVFVFVFFRVVKNSFETGVLMMLIALSLTKSWLPLGSNFILATAFSGSKGHQRLNFFAACRAIPIRRVSVFRSVFVHGFIIGLECVAISILAAWLVMGSHHWWVNIKQIHIGPVPVRFEISALLFSLSLGGMNTNFAVGDRIWGMLYALAALLIWPLLKVLEAGLPSNSSSLWAVVFFFWALVLGLVGITVFKHLHPFTRSNS